MRKVIATFLLFFGQAYAYEVKDVCAKYQTNYTWSKSYRVQVQIYSGQELNRAVNSYTQFNSWNHYAVIWWADGQASIIKLDMYMANMILFDTSGVDQNGRHWKLSDDNLGV